MMPATYTAAEVAELLGVSTWSIYAAVKEGNCPVAPIKVGRRLVWPKAAVDRLLGLDDQPERGAGHRLEVVGGGDPAA